MKMSLIFFILIGIVIKCPSQNLIPNPGFDSIQFCPPGNVGGSNSSIRAIVPWVSITLDTIWETTAYYNTCATDINYGVPSNYRGFQEAHSKNGYVEILTYRNFNYERGYIGTQLLKPLEKNKKYFVRFYVSPGDDNGTSKNFILTRVFSDAIGIHFTDTLMKATSERIELIPSIERFGTIIDDTTAWTPVCGIYKAKGGERFANIGNFRTDDKTLIKKTGDTRVSNVACFMFIDDVSVTEFNPLPDSTVIICVGETLKYNAAFLNGTYQWNTGSIDSIITINKSGVYSVSVTLDNCILTDSVVVISTQNSAPILRRDTTLCQGKQIELSAAAVPGQYLWSTNANTPNITVNKTNNYAVTITNRCGTYNDDVDITFKHCACNVYVPNAFSPNNDGVNDELQVYFGCDFNYQVKRFQVFNRWGSPIFSSFNTNDIHWNGQINGKQLPPDAYVWYLEYEFELDGKMKNVIESGDFTIVY